MDRFSIEMRFNEVTLHIEDPHIMATASTDEELLVVICKVYGVWLYDF